MGKLIDKEYSTSWITEVVYLNDNGIRYTFVKTIDGVTVYKYKKCKKLFDSLSKLYRNLGIISEDDKFRS
nr:MAG TPA: hypothetical protein [Caudoviricetes sp.]